MGLLDGNGITGGEWDYWRGLPITGERGILILILLKRKIGSC